MVWRHCGRHQWSELLEIQQNQIELMQAMLKRLPGAGARRRNRAIP